MSFDLVIRNGTVVDGSGAPARRADVGIVADRITEIGRITERARQEIDADGLAVTPGFIDGHTHMDAQVFWDRLGTNTCWHGVTTAVMGHCGFTLAPTRRGSTELVTRNLERAEDIAAEAMAQGIEWTWQTFSEYLEAVDQQPKAINYAANVGHSALRTWAMGERAFEEAPTDDDLAEMRRELRSALDAGAFGLTTSRSDAHETSDGRPVASRVAPWDEVHELVEEMGRAGGGIFQIALEPATFSPDPDVREEFFDRMRMLCLASGVTFSIPVPGYASASTSLDFLDRVTDERGSIFGLCHSAGASTLLSFKTHLPMDVLAEWRPIRAEPLAEQRRLLRDPELRARLVEAADRGPYGSGIGAEPRPPDYDRIFVLQRPVPPNPTVAELAAARRLHPVELMMELALDTDFEQFFSQPLGRFDQEALVRVMKHPLTVMTFSDSGAHVSQVADTIHTHLLAYWVRHEQRFTLEEAIQMLSAAPAKWWGLADRGLLRPGFVADLNVLDPDTVAPGMPEVVHDLPGGATRLLRRADGFAATVVGGEVTFRDGEHTGSLPGSLLRRR